MRKIYPHGTFNRYTNNRCRCEPCRVAATAHSREYRAKVRAEGRVLVDAKEVRKHLNYLTSKNVGLATVADIVDCWPWALRRIRNRQVKKVKRDFAQRILAVDEGAIADGATKSSAATRRAIKRLRKLGVSCFEIAQARGWGTGTGLTYPKGLVTARTEFRILRFLREVEQAVADGEAAKDVCAQCGLDHSQPARVARLRRLDRSATFTDANEVWPCVYPATSAGERLYYRDTDVLKGKPRYRRPSERQAQL